MSRRTFGSLLLSVAAVITAPSIADADVVRFRYRPVDNCGRTVLAKSANGAAGRWRPWALGVRTANYYCEPKATHVVTFSHPCSGRPIQVPIRFPSGTPRIAYQSDAIVYSFGTYTIRVEFNSDGSADVVYNSGAFRPIDRR